MAPWNRGLGLTLVSSILALGGFAASKVKVTPLTCKSRLKSFGVTSPHLVKFHPKVTSSINKVVIVPQKKLEKMLEKCFSQRNRIVRTIAKGRSQGEVMAQSWAKSPWITTGATPGRNGLPGAGTATRNSPRHSAPGVRPNGANGYVWFCMVMSGWASWMIYDDFNGFRQPNDRKPGRKPGSYALLKCGSRIGCWLRTQLVDLPKNCRGTVTLCMISGGGL